MYICMKKIDQGNKKKLIQASKTILYIFCIESLLSKTYVYLMLFYPKVMFVFIADHT